LRRWDESKRGVVMLEIVGALALPITGAGISSCFTLNADASNTRLFSYGTRVLLGFGGMRGNFAPGFGSLIEILKSKIRP
jgi:hypothetical protein